MMQGLSQASNIQQANTSNVSEDPMVTIKKLHELLMAGALTQAEFDAKKQELLSKIK
jgi:hypothetical protein